MREYISFLSAEINAFTDFMTASERYSDGYQKFMSMFDRYIAANYPNEMMLSQNMVDRYFEKRPSESKNSLRARTNVVVAFIRYLQKRELANIKEPERARQEKCTHLPHAFTQDELQRFFYTCDNIRIQNAGKANIVRKLILCIIFRLMYCTGLRPNEARELRRADADLDHGVLNIVKTKGHDQHYVAVHETMLKELREYDRRMDSLVPNRMYFFPGPKGGFRDSEWLRKNFRRLWDEANPNSNAVSYDFRHNYAIENVNSWKDCGFEFYDKLYYLSRSMGHCNVESTRYYYSIVPTLAEQIKEKTESSFDEIIPEVDCYESW